MRPAVIVAAASVAALLVAAGQARAQANRTFVSGFGSDANPCTLAAPCRSFAQALTQTSAGGEITVLDPAGYGAVTITKSVSIVNDGVGEAGITAPANGTAITVTVGVNDVVNLRGLTLVGAGGFSGDGVVFTNLGTLNIQNCVIRGFPSFGLNLVPTGTAAFNVSDTIVSNVNGFGIDITPFGSGTVTAVFNRVQVVGFPNTGFDFTLDGASSTGTLDVTIANSTASNSGFGIATQSNTGQANTQVMIVNSIVANNGTGIAEVGANSTTYLARNTITGNGTAFDIVGGGALFSFGDNEIKGNGDDSTSPAIPLVSTK